jgi:hypothetical protein
MSRPLTAHAHRRIQAIASLAILVAMALVTEAGKRWG